MNSRRGRQRPDSRGTIYPLNQNRSRGWYPSLALNVRNPVAVGLPITLMVEKLT